MKAMKTLVLCIILLCGALVLGAQNLPEWQWAVRAGGTGNDRGESIAIDSQGNQYVTGYLQDTATFGSHTLTASGGYDIFVAKLDPSGYWLWAAQAGGINTDDGNGIAVDSSGNAYVTGHIGGSATFGNHILTSSGYSPVTFVAKLDSSGNWLWAVKSGGTSYEYDFGHGIAVDSSGNACVTGYFEGTSTFGSHILTASGWDIYAAKLDPSGNWLWAVKAGGAESDYGYGIAVDEVGNAYVTGSYQGTATFGSHTLTDNGGYSEIFAAKLDPSGTWLWAVKAGGAGDVDIGYGDHGNGIAVDGAGNAYVTGEFRSIATFGSHILTASGDYDIFAAKLDPNGTWLWAVQAGGTSADFGKGITVDGVGHAYVTGFFLGTATFGSNILTASGWDIYAAKLDPSGNWLWVVKAGGPYYHEYGYGTAIDGLGNVYVTGSYQGTATFGSHALTSSGNQDIFVAKLVPPTLNADFSADNLSGLEPLAVQFSDESTAGDYPISSWLWSFGDGGSSTQQNPLHTYTTQGVYTVSLTVVDQNNQTSTSVRPDYITVVERIYSTELLSLESLSFGSVYLEEQSDWQEITFSNMGNVDLSFSEAHFLAEPLHFELSEDSEGLVLPPGESETLLVRFAPQAVGALSDTLFIFNNSTNLPIIKVKLSGTGLYVPPKAPMNVAVTMDGDNAVLTWDAVTQNIHDQPLSPDYYFIFNSSDPYGVFGYHGSASGLQYIHPMVGAFQPRMFYRVVAYKYYGRGSFDLASLGLEPGMTEDEVTRRLKLSAE